MSVPDRPSLSAEARGGRPPFPSAIRLARVDELLRQWCRPVSAAEVKKSDVEWPLGSGEYLRPGPIAEARPVGRVARQRPYAGGVGVAGGRGGAAEGGPGSAVGEWGGWGPVR